MPSVPAPASEPRLSVLVVAALLQFRQRDLGDRGAGRGRRARHRAEHAAGQHVDVHQPARQPVQPRRKAAKHFLRQSRAEQDFAHPDEQRQAPRATTTRCCPTPSSPARCPPECRRRRIACRPSRVAISATAIQTPAPSSSVRKPSRSAAMESSSMSDPALHGALDDLLGGLRLRQFVARRDCRAGRGRARRRRR